MDRRNVLALVGAGVSIPSGYVAWNWYQSPSLPDGMTVETLYVTGNVIRKPSLEDPVLGPQKERHRIIRDQETATDEITFRDSAIEFAEETDFDNSYLVLVQTGMQTEPDLELEAISRTDDGLDFDVAVAHRWWEGGHDDLGSHSLLIRVTDREDNVPETISINIEGYV